MAKCLFCSEAVTTNPVCAACLDDFSRIRAGRALDPPRASSSDVAMERSSPRFAGDEEDSDEDTEDFDDTDDDSDTDDEKVVDLNRFDGKIPPPSHP